MRSPKGRSGSASEIRTIVQRVLYPPTRPPRRSLQSLLSYTGKGITAVSATALFFAGGFFRARSRARLDILLSEIGLGRERIAARLPSISTEDLPGTQRAVKILEPIASDGNVTLLELLVLSRLVADLRPEVAFEIGTFDGRTALNIAANTDGKVVTLDLPASQINATDLPLDPSDAKYVAKPVSGARFLNRPERSRIVQVFGDSASFDFSPWYGRADIVFIDGAHSKDYVLNDTDRALRLLKPAGGIILWHDYDASFDGVTLALHQIADKGLPVRRVEGTSLAIMVAGPNGPGGDFRTGRSRE